MNQAELITYLNDPQTITRAAEGSMTRRNALLDRTELAKIVASNLSPIAKIGSIQDYITTNTLDTLLELQALAIAYNVRDEDRLVNVQDFLKRRILQLVSQ